jgi:hypothetical protein
MLTKNQIICCGMMSVSFLKFQPFDMANDSRRRLAANEGPWPWT